MKKIDEYIKILKDLYPNVNERLLRGMFQNMILIGMIEANKKQLKK